MKLLLKILSIFKEEATRKTTLEDVIERDAFERGTMEL